MWYSNHCPVCSGTDRLDFAELKGVPVEVGYLWATPEAARVAPHGDIHLAVCRRCGYIGNSSFDVSQIDYHEGYEVSLHHSPIYETFLTELADTLIARYRLSGGTVVEIGCGADAHFLRRLLERGVRLGIGVDPCVVKDGEIRVGAGTLRRIAEAYGPQHERYPAKLIICRHALHQLNAPSGFLAAVRRACNVAPAQGVYVEVPNAADIIRPEMVWRLMYPYCSFFTAGTLAAQFRAAGFHVSRAASCFVDGQYLALEAVPVWTSEPPAWQQPGPEDEVRYLAFGRALRRQLVACQERVAALLASGRRLAVWGAGGRGVNFVNLVPAAGEISAVVDINPDRQGAYMPGTGQYVTAPEALLANRPDTVIITNPTYLEEIQAQLSGMELKCEVVTI